MMKPKGNYVAAPYDWPMRDIHQQEAGRRECELKMFFNEIRRAEDYQAVLDVVKQMMNDVYVREHKLMTIGESSAWNRYAKKYKIKVVDVPMVEPDPQDTQGFAVPRSAEEIYTDLKKET